MQTQGVAAVLVVEDGRLAGICTERDLVVDVLAADLDARRTPVSAVMTADPFRWERRCRSGMRCT